MVYTVVVYSYQVRLVSTTCFNSKVTPTNNINYSRHVKDNRTCMITISHDVCIMPLVINSLGSRHTDICHGHIQFLETRHTLVQDWYVPQLTTVKSENLKASQCLVEQSFIA